MMFVSQKPPDLDSFAWCNGFRQADFDRFVQRKKASHLPWRSHEPVGYFESQEHLARVKLASPARGKYFTIKLSTLRNNMGTLLWERVRFRCINGSHPLGALLVCVCVCVCVCVQVCEFVCVCVLCCLYVISALCSVCRC